LAVPERPAIWREVTSIIDGVQPSNPQFQRPHLPALRTTRDGRIGLVVVGAGGRNATPRFILLQPEKMAGPLLSLSPGSFTVASPDSAWLAGYNTPQASQGEFTNNSTDPVAHACLWDDVGATSVNGDDVYDVKVFVTVNFSTGGSQFFVTPVHIVVHNPKTANAVITSVTRTPGTTIAGIPLPFSNGAFEPVICGDGKLLIVRFHADHLPPASAPFAGQGADICYSYYSNGNTADPSLWTVFYPISHAPFDPVVSALFDFARQQFRDPAGNLIADGRDIGGSYPWIDRDAKHLFFEGIHDRLHYFDHANLTWDAGRYPQVVVPGDPWAYYFHGLGTDTVLQEDTGLHQGITMLGLWTGGKMVQLDSLNNDMDYAVGTQSGIVVPTTGNELGPQQRLVTLFNGPAGMGGSDQLRLGYGRATERMPLQDNNNGNIIDSIQNKMNYRRFLRPQSFHDVVWHLGNRQTDELVFDDFLDPDAVVVADMNGLLTLTQTTGINTLEHQTGWDEGTHTFTGVDVRLQNAATTLTWSVPGSGLVTGPGRIEPAATGGIHGKGLWMDGTIGLDFAVPAQSGNQVSTHDWYAGLFVDCRFDNDNVERRLLTFPDGTSIRLFGRHQVRYADAAGNLMGCVTLPDADAVTYPDYPDLLPKAGWAHLAFQIRNGGTQVEFLLDGLPYHRWQHPTVALFQMAPVPGFGDLIVGNVPGATQPGFRGWIDELRVLAHTVDPESACNHSAGTLVGLPSGYNGTLNELVARFPTWSQAAISAELQNRGKATFDHYACFFDYLHDNGAGAATVPAGTTSLRAAIHFPEGPLFHNAPRPDTQQNSFCTSCHHQGGQQGLSLLALQYNGINAAADPRRQPAQPPKLLFGAIPANLVEGDAGNQPPTSTTAPATGLDIDPLILSTWTGPAVVQTFTVLDGATGKDLMQLTNGGTIDPAQLGTSSFRLRANPVSAQGSITLVLDGGTPLSVPTSPYLVPASAVTFTPGTSHVLTATPSGGTTVTVNFNVAGTVRVIAGYASDFQGNGPKAGWYYCWNKNAAVNVPSGYVPLSWHPGSGQYTAFGLAYPESSTDCPECPNGALGPGGGYPGKGTLQGTSADRYVIAGYRAEIDGYYGVINGAVSLTDPNSTGAVVKLYTQTSSGMTPAFSTTIQPGVGLLMLPQNLGFLHAGDMIWFCVGPSRSDVSDSFAMDFNVRYSEQPF
jgi:hypothetical protein